MLLDHKLKQKNINIIKTIISATTITHVMYVDNIVLFSKAIKRVATNLSGSLEKYYKWSD